jgi:hypothetical protein
MTGWLLRRGRRSCQVGAGDHTSTSTIPAIGFGASQSIYRDGTFLISSSGEARTWAVCHRGRWGVVYEWLGEQPVAGWVSAEQIPLEVRAVALHASEPERR